MKEVITPDDKLLSQLVDGLTDIRHSADRHIDRLLQDPPYDEVELAHYGILLCQYQVFVEAAGNFLQDPIATHLPEHETVRELNDGLSEKVDDLADVYAVIERRAQRRSYTR